MRLGLCAGNHSGQPFLQRRRKGKGGRAWHLEPLDSNKKPMEPYLEGKLAKSQPCESAIRNARDIS